MKQLYILILTIFSAFSVQGQTTIRDNDELREESGTDYEGHSFEDKEGLKEMIKARNFPNAENNFGRYLEEMKNYKNSNPSQLVANWSNVNSTGTGNVDVGRASSITLDTINPGRFYICTPHSGVWVTNNDGASYIPITESLPTQNTSCLVIDPSNTNQLYLATGTHNLDMPPNSMGIYKSVDAGSTWTATGLTFMPSSGFTIGDLIINPENNNSLLAATTDGLYRTYDGGTTWTKILSDTISSVRFSPTDTTLIYALGSRYYRSDNAGVSFAQISNGINVSFQWKYEYYLRTSAAAPNTLYLFTCGGAYTTFFYSVMYVHKSTDNGQTFTLIDSLNTEVCHQVDVSQINPDKMVAGYRTTWKRENSSSGFQQMTNWYTSSLPYLHADQRGVLFDPHNDNTFYFCNDGGVYRTTDNGATFQNLTANMQLAHLYDFANSQDTAYKILVSTLDVSPYIIGDNGIDFTFTQFVESFASAMSPVNDDHFFLTHQSPAFTTNGGATFFASTHPLIVNSSYYLHSLQYDECDESVSYFSSYNDVFKSTDSGANFKNFVTTTYNPVNSFSGSPRGYVVCRANPRYIYVYYKDSVYVTKDGTSNFANITAGLPVALAQISHMVVDPANENNVWISFTGYSANNKVFRSNDAGQTWTNISGGIPNIPVNALAIQQGIGGAVYAAADGGVFYIDDSFSSWQFYSTGLPSVIISHIEIQRTEGKLRVATFGRGVWESDLYQPTPANYILPPVALFTPETVHGCLGESITMNNTSCGVVDSVVWSFPGGTPSSSTLFSPDVVYTSPGNYSITLIVYNAGGTDTLTLTDIVNIETPVSLPYYEPVADLNAFVLPAGAWTTEANGDGATWNRGFWTDGSSGSNDDFIFYDNFTKNLAGLEEKLVFPQFDLTGTIQPKLFFYRSYKLFNQFITDSLKISVQICGGTDTIVYAKGGPQLASVPGTIDFSYWIPTMPSDWVRDSVDLTPFAGNASVTISFIDKGYNGQLLYIDEFRIQETSTVGLGEIHDAQLNVFPNPTSGNLHIRTNQQPISKIVLLDLMGRMVIEKDLKVASYDETIDISALSNGMYFLFVNNGTKGLRVVKGD